VDDLLEECRKKLRAKDVAMLQRERGLLVEHNIMSPEIVSQMTYSDLHALKLSAGAAAALKAAFPSAGGCHSACATLGAPQHDHGCRRQHHAACLLAVPLNPTHCRLLHTRPLVLTLAGGSIVLAVRHLTPGIHIWHGS
jgi:hypothetical protein